MLIINHFRTYKKGSTIGSIYIGGTMLGRTLEDVARPPNVKVYGETCIPEGTYEAKVTHSNRYGRQMIELTSEGKDCLDRDGVEFKGIRVHGGNDVDDSEGCILLGTKSNGTNRIWDCAEVNRELVHHVLTSERTLWVISSY